MKKEKVIFSQYIIVKGIKYIVDGKKVVLEPSKKEIDMAIWLSKKLNKEVTILPRINEPERIQTPDFSIENDNWDLKTITSNKNNVMYNTLRNKENQSNNYVIDISKSKLTIKAINKQLNDLFLLKGFNWLNKIIVKKNNDIEINERKKVGNRSH